MRISVQNQLLIGFIVALLILGIIGGLFYENVNQIVETTTQRGRSYQELALLEAFLSHAKDAETGQRGYLLTFRKNYLTTYTLGRSATQYDFKQLEKMFNDNAIQQTRLRQLKPLIDDKLAELQETIQLRNTQGFGAALKLVQTDRGKKDMDAVRHLIGMMREDELKELKRRDNELQKNSQSILLFSFFAGISAITLFILIFYMLKRESKAREMANKQLKLEIDERVKAEQKIQELNHNLEQQVITLDSVNKELEAFSYSVSHDLRAPLRSIDGFSQALLSRNADQLDEKGKDFLNRVRSNSQRMAQLIDDMLQLSRLTRGEMTVQPLDLTDIAQEIMDTLHEQEPNRQVTVHIQPGLKTCGDKRLLQAVLQNLLANAWKFTSNHPTAEISLGKTSNNGKTAFFVKDDGAGFDMKYSDKLFGAFQRLHGMTEFSGTGIGLATVQRIIHRHGGEIWADAAVEKGATFYFTLPDNK